MRTTENDQCHKSYYRKNLSKVSQTENQTGTREEQNSFVEGIIDRKRHTCALLNTLRHLKEYDMMRHPTNTVEDRWKRSTSDRKYALGTHNSNAS